MRAAFIDANASLADIMRRLRRADDLPVAIHEDPDIAPEALPALMEASARRWLCRANASCASRAMPRSLATFSAVTPMW